jgi:hypothetical protein|uniref:Uncharacterized protein n=1 Tax=viral metagenome TaxID=1070528 RepID=A0A6C0DTI0_9ZZZZ
MELKINVDDEENIKIDPIRFQKMLFVYNALEEGWTIKKKKDSFVFSKNHEGKKEVFLESYLVRFMKSNFDFNKLLN